MLHCSAQAPGSRSPGVSVALPTGLVACGRALVACGLVIGIGHVAHGFVVLASEGKVWRVVLAPPTRMENRGLPREMLKVGAMATVVGYPNRAEPDELRAERITIGAKTTELR